ncbi:low temperature requirement protein LtrA [Naumannella cuiyingiana]|uniref:Low temperature requirement protein LtrA n=1 Tax=Naumannella cuiyingiana TaxID=1347891 RepID=A0A7Z0D9U7_9ACTN|nr:low temperature requirement protein A [Naumannella cuiyingiana]NYI71416.1 low temperature requirement protein LtrA [Naumannella cuiyingiana]
MTETSGTRGLSHRLVPMRGRDPEEPHRAATPLELLFDLVFVVAVGIASSTFAHSLGEAHWASAILAFAFVMYAIVWAWFGWTTFASAFDTDDWLYRLLTMLQMCGVVVLALGVPPVFSSLDAGQVVDNRVLVLGYVIMRIAMALQWLRVSRGPYRRVAHTHIATIVIAQAGWILTAILPLPLPALLALIAVLYAVELGGPALAERRQATPWHAHHLAERFGLLTIIMLGECVVGTIAAVSAAVGEQGWTLDAALVTFAGVGLTFGMWWIYFIVPHAETLERRRGAAIRWAYGHFAIFAPIAAVGAGLDVGAYEIEGKNVIGPIESILTVAVPLAIYLIVLFWFYRMLSGSSGPYAWMLVGALVVIAAAVAIVAAGVPFTVGLAILTLAPVVVIVGDEVIGHRHREAHVARLES